MRVRLTVEGLGQTFDGLGDCGLVAGYLDGEGAAAVAAVDRIERPLVGRVTSGCKGWATSQDGHAQSKRGHKQHCCFLIHQNPSLGGRCENKHGEKNTSIIRPILCANDFFVKSCWAFVSRPACLQALRAQQSARLPKAIKTKNTTTTILSYLTKSEVDALLAVPDQNTVTGRRDHVMILVFSTGLRVRELIGLTQQDLQLSTPVHLLCHGKGRKDRITPLNKETTRALRTLRAARPDALPRDPIFTAQGSSRALGRDAIAARLRLYCAAATATSPSLKNKTITPHTLRHTTAMRMLEAGIDITTIALWLGHESTQATQAYLHADLGMKERALA
ncbi:hypothetical protein E3T26_03710 [Cryobacterium sp. TMT1-21]|nr:hypothetical protein E3T24_09070 [Cryobacterium sp. TmT2-59]TFD11744.1 hypothetical protein E3T42_15915 [Cryobacterium sp. TMT4-10]TFD16666.1 hypothetical protein E3T26_03710 [Cryobacterium sp. TMT1-21]TFD39514.1 hypothetical protein E3T37_07635 [Cryobacterium sp. TMT2-10]